MFNKTKEVFDHAIAGHKYSIEFPYTNIYLIKSIEISCTCLDYEWDAVNSVIKVDFTPDSIPPHLKLMGKNCYEVTKKLTVVYKVKPEPYLEQEETQILLIEAKVFNN